MPKKRSVFDIDFDLSEDAPVQTAPEFPAGNQDRNEGLKPDSHRRGPMASAISEAAEANADRARQEAAIRAENDSLAHEHVRLKKLGLITDLIPTDQIRISKLIRDRAAGADPELEELKMSIQDVGLSNPIRVEQSEDGSYELIQGFRRLSAFKEIALETGDQRYNKIPAALVPRGEPVIGLYRKMVDENLVRKDVSFGEMAQLARGYAAEAGVDVSDAVSELYASARKQKRTYIRQFARVLELSGDALEHIDAIPRALGLDLYKALEATPERAGELVRQLGDLNVRTAETELAVLREFLTDRPAPQPRASRKSSAKTSLRLPRKEGEARVIAADGRIELRLDRDFSGVSKARLQEGIEALLKALDED